MTPDKYQVVIKHSLQLRPRTVFELDFTCKQNVEPDLLPGCTEDCIVQMCKHICLNIHAISGISIRVCKKQGGVDTIKLIQLMHCDLQNI